MDSRGRAIKAPRRRTAIKKQNHAAIFEGVEKLEDLEPRIVELLLTSNRIKHDPTGELAGARLNSQGHFYRHDAMHNGEVPMVTDEFWPMCLLCCAWLSRV